MAHGSYDTPNQLQNARNKASGVAETFRVRLMGLTNF